MGGEKMKLSEEDKQEMKDQVKETLEIALGVAKELLNTLANDTEFQSAIARFNTGLFNQYINLGFSREEALGMCRVPMANLASGK
jgi:coenzyme F420-reducing hydrogenase alpha subunit